jgi:hypothetical protein
LGARSPVAQAPDQRRRTTRTCVLVVCLVLPGGAHLGPAPDRPRTSGPPQHRAGVVAQGRREASVTKSNVPGLLRGNTTKAPRGGRRGVSAQSASEAPKLRVSETPQSEEPEPDCEMCRDLPHPVATHCRLCHASWTRRSNIAHCVTCHRTFITHGVLDRHLKPVNQRGCNDPATVMVTRAGERVHFYREPETNQWGTLVWQTAGDHPRNRSVAGGDAS